MLESGRRKRYLWGHSEEGVMLAKTLLGTMLLVIASTAGFANPWDNAAGPSPDGQPAPVQGDDFNAGFEAVKAGDYATAIDRLSRVVTIETNNAEAFNLLGYSHRKMQNLLPALQAYTRALEINPTHTGAHAYIGEAYLELGNLAKAEYHLAQLDLICLEGCDHFYALQEKVELYRANYSG